MPTQYLDYRVLTYPLSAVLNQINIGGFGRVLQVLQLTHAEANPVVAIGDAGNTQIPLIAGRRLAAPAGEEFENVFLSTDTAAAGGTIKILFTMGLELDDVPSLSLDLIQHDLATSQVALNASTATAVPAANLTGRHSVTIQNLDAAIDCYLGDSTVTTSTGLKLSPGGSISLPLSEAVTIYAIAASGTPSVAAMEAY